MKDLKPRVKEARILQGALDEIAIVPREEVAAIDKLSTAANVRDEFKDISGFAGQARDLYRNFEHFFGNKYATEYRQVTQNSSALPAPGNEVPAAPPAAPSGDSPNL